MPEETKTMISSEFDVLNNARSSSLERKRECAGLVLPSLLPEAGHNESTDYMVPYSSSPARMVAALASKIISTVVPLNNLQYFEIAIDDNVQQDLDPTELIKKLAAKQAGLVTKLNNTNIRQALYLAVQHLIVNGDALLCMYDTGAFQVHRIDNYVVERYGDGTVHKIILREWVNRRALPEDLKGFAEATDNVVGAYKWEPVFLKIEYDGTNKWKWNKEFRNKSAGSGTWDVLPYWALRWKSGTGENYGTSLCEENIGDLRVLQGISKAIIDGIAINSEFRWGIDPSGITEPQDIEDTENCSFVPARQQDMFPIQAGNFVQVEQMAGYKSAIERSLARVFLMETEVQPQQERVTATQIRSISNELQMALTGVLPMLNQEMMQPVIRRKMYLEAKTDPELAEIFKMIDVDVFSVKIRTGLEALGREVENSQMGQILSQVLQLPPEAQKVFNWPGVVLRWLASTGINTNGMVFTAEEVAQRDQQAMEQQMAAAGAEQGMAAAAKSLGNPPQ